MLSEFVYTVTSDLYANTLSSGGVTALALTTLWALVQDEPQWCGSFALVPMCSGGDPVPVRAVCAIAATACTGRHCLLTRGRNGGADVPTCSARSSCSIAATAPTLATEAVSADGGA